MERKPYRCRAFGLVLAAERPIYGLQPVPDTTSVDVVVHFSGLPPDISPESWEAEPFYRTPPPDEGNPFISVFRIAGGAVLRLLMADGAEFFVSAAGTEMWVNASQSHDDVVDEYLVGPVCALILRRRAIVCLHASAVAVDGVGVAFAGGEMAGKSTVAALLAMRGHTVITDDLAAIVSSRTGILIQPGVSYLRARPGLVDVAAASLGRADHLESVRSGRYLDLTARSGRYAFASSPTPLASVYFLEWSHRAGRVTSINDMSGPDALTGLLAHTWASKLLDRSERAAELEVLSRLVDQTTVRRLTLGPVVDADELAHAVETDVRRLSAASGVSHA